MPTNALSNKGKENEASLHNLDTLILNFSKLTLPEIYTIQHVAVTEIRIREATAASQAAGATRKARAWTQLINRQHAELAAQAERQTLLE